MAVASWCGDFQIFRCFGIFYTACLDGRPTISGFMLDDGTSMDEEEPDFLGF